MLGRFYPICHPCPSGFLRSPAPVYGIDYRARADDPQLLVARRDRVAIAARALDDARMLRYTVDVGTLSSTELVRPASLPPSCRTTHSFILLRHFCS